MEHGEAALLDAIERGKRAWPDVRLSDADFVAYLVARAETPEELASAKIEDLFLACACARGDAAAIAAFESYLNEVDVAFARVRAPVSADEVKQQLRLRLLVGDGEGEPPRLTLYRGAGDLRGWVRVVATRHLLNLATRVAPDAKGGGDDALAGVAAATADPELALLKQRRGVDLKRAFERAASELSDRERALLRQSLVERLSIDTIGDRHGIHRSTAARWVAAARSALQKNVRRALHEALGISDTEVESMLRVIESDIELSVSRLLGSPASRGESA